jgi:hypothetical protein
VNDSEKAWSSIIIPIPITTKTTFGVVLLENSSLNQWDMFFVVLFFSSSFLERKRGRQTYTRYQTLELEKEFHFNREVSYFIHLKTITL